MYSPAFKIRNRIWPVGLTFWRIARKNFRSGIRQLFAWEVMKEKKTKWSHTFGSTPIASPGHSSLVMKSKSQSIGAFKSLSRHPSMHRHCHFRTTQPHVDRPSQSWFQSRIVSTSPSQPLLTTSQGLFPSTKMGTHFRLTTQRCNIDG